MLNQMLRVAETDSAHTQTGGGWPKPAEPQKHNKNPDCFAVHKETVRPVFTPEEAFPSTGAGL